MRRAASADSPRALVEARVFLAFLEAETARHFEQEEHFVFPLLGSAHPDVQRALDDHRTLVAALGAETESGVVSPERLVELASALEVHIRFERELFEEVQRRTGLFRPGACQSPPGNRRGTRRGLSVELTSPGPAIRKTRSGLASRLR